MSSYACKSCRLSLQTQPDHSHRITIKAYHHQDCCSLSPEVNHPLHPIYLKDKSKHHSIVSLYLLSSSLLSEFSYWLQHQNHPKLLVYTYLNHVLSSPHETTFERKDCHLYQRADRFSKVKLLKSCSCIKILSVCKALFLIF